MHAADAGTQEPRVQSTSYRIFAVTVVLQPTTRASTFRKFTKTTAVRKEIV